MSRLGRHLGGVLLLAAACGGAEEKGARPAALAPPPDRDSWWNGSTTDVLGRERILAPRELRALLAEGRRRGFDRDDAWWGRRNAWACERILELDPEDVEANAGTGRRTLQSLEGFAATWDAMLATRMPTEEITGLLDRYAGWVLEERPVFLTQGEFEVERARLARAAEHLARLGSDPRYAALHGALRQVRSSFHADYPFLYVEAGPVLVFYAARDLQRDPLGEPEAEEQRLSQRRELYRRRLEAWTGVYAALLDDLETLHPALVRELGRPPLLCQWIFAERGWYADFKDRIRREEPDPPYRHGLLHDATGWAYLVEPVFAGDAAEAQKDPSGGLAETAAYLAARQLLRHWARDAQDPLVNHMDRSDAYWMKEGWASFLAARRTSRPRVGPLLATAHHGLWEFPPLVSVVARRSRLDPPAALGPPDREGAELLVGADGGHTDLAELLVRYLVESRQDAFEQFLLSQVRGTRRGVGWFEECFQVRGTADWRTLERAVYARIRTE